MQYRILKEVLEKYFKIPDYIYAFERDKSIPVMAKMHEGSFQVVSLDIKDYFPSIKQNVLLGLMKGVGFGESPARTLSEIMTLGPNVPQGALTSPKISNIVASTTFGPAVKEYCDQRGLSLTIYADDITISSKSAFNANEAIDFVSGVLESFNFRVNTAKTKVMKKGSRHSRLYVCGTVVNEKVNLLKTERLRLRAIVHNSAKNGLEAEANKTGLTANEFLMRVRGKLNWFGQLNPEGSSVMIERFKKVCTDWEEASRSTPFEYQPQ
jgi:RNA-directed DNA polymerase